MEAVEHPAREGGGQPHSTVLRKDRCGEEQHTVVLLIKQHPAELDAILAAHAGAPAGPDAAEREAAAALLGLDPGIAGDAALYDAALPGLPDADGEDILAAWLGEADTGAPPPEWPDPGGDWMIG